MNKGFKPYYPSPWFLAIADLITLFMFAFFVTHVNMTEKTLIAAIGIFTVVAILLYFLLGWFFGAVYFLLSRLFNSVKEKRKSK